MILHANITNKLPEDDLRKFSGSTLARLRRSYKRLLHPDSGVSPKPERIVQDVLRIPLSLHMVKAAEGCIIDEASAKRSGRRYGVNNNRKRGGPRQKSSQDTYRELLAAGDLHQDVLDIRNSAIQESIRRHISDMDENNNNNTTNSDSEINKRSENSENSELGSE